MVCSVTVSGTRLCGQCYLNHFKRVIWNSSNSSTLSVQVGIRSDEDAKCVCNPEAGCRDIGCRCWVGAIEYQPHLNPEQEIIVGCPECPELGPGHCLESLVRLACQEFEPCDSDQLLTYERVNDDVPGGTQD